MVHAKNSRATGRNASDKRNACFARKSSSLYGLWITRSVAASAERSWFAAEKRVRNKFRANVSSLSRANK